MGLFDRIAEQREEFQRQLLQASREEATARLDAEAAAALQQVEARQIAELATKFAAWAKQSNIRPEKQSRREGRKRCRKVYAWQLMTIRDGSGGQETHNGHPPMKTLYLYVDGRIEWEHTNSMFSSTASLVNLEAGIVDFVAKSASRVPWQD